MVFAFLTFVLIAGFITGLYWVLIVSPERRTRQQLRKRLLGSNAPVRKAPTSPTFVTDQRFSTLGGLQKALMRLGGLTQPLQAMLDQAGMTFTVGSLVLGSVCASLMGFVVASSVTRAFGIRLACALAAALLPVVYVRHKGSVRHRRFEELFPEALDIIARSLRAGHAFTTGLAIAAEQVPDPVASELKKLYDSQNYGRPFEEAILEFARRAPILDARFFATAVLTQRETGGNLSEILDNLTSVIRDRFRVKRQVRVLTAQGRFSGWVLAAAPPALAAMIFLVNPEHMLAMFRDPIGIRLLIGATVLQAFGTLLIKRIIDVEY
jgi:tight adherence protein B